MQRFEREAKGAARLTDRHVAKVYELGQQDGRWFIVQEFVEGQSLQARVEEEGPLPLGEAMRIGAGISAGPWAAAGESAPAAGALSVDATGAPSTVAAAAGAPSLFSPSSVVESLGANPYFNAGAGLFGIGVLAAVGKMTLRSLEYWMRRKFMMSLEVPSKDRSYPWVMHWLAEKGLTDSQHLR